MLYNIQIIGPKTKKRNSTYEFDAHLYDDTLYTNEMPLDIVIVRHAKGDLSSLSTR